jgi:hypothetical protein
LTKKLIKTISSSDPHKKQNFFNFYFLAVRMIESECLINPRMARYFERAVDELRETVVEPDCFMGYALSLEPNVCANPITTELDANNIAWPLLCVGNIKQSDESYTFLQREKHEPYYVDAPSIVPSALNSLQKFAGPNPEIYLVGEKNTRCHYFPPDESLTWGDAKIAVQMCEPHNIRSTEVNYLIDRAKRDSPCQTDMLYGMAWNALKNEFDKRRSAKNGSRKDLDFYFESVEAAEEVSEAVRIHLLGEKKPLNHEGSFATLRFKAGAAQKIEELREIVVGCQTIDSYISEKTKEADKLTKQIVSRKGGSKPNNWRKAKLDNAFNPLASWNINGTEREIYKRGLFSSSVFVFDGEQDTPYEIQLIFKFPLNYLPAEKEVEGFDANYTRCFIKLLDGQLYVHWNEECEEDVRSGKVTLKNFKCNVLDQMNAKRIHKFGVSDKNVVLSDSSAYKKVWRRKLALKWLESQFETVHFLTKNLRGIKNEDAFVQKTMKDLDGSSTLHLVVAANYLSSLLVYNDVSVEIFKTAKEVQPESEVLFILPAFYLREGRGTGINELNIHSKAASFNNVNEIKEQIYEQLNGSVCYWTGKYLEAQGVEAESIWGESESSIFVLFNKAKQHESMRIRTLLKNPDGKGKNLQAVFSSIGTLIAEGKDEPWVYDFYAEAMTVWHLYSGNLFQPFNDVDRYKRVRKHHSTQNGDLPFYLKIDGSRLKMIAEEVKSILQAEADFEKRFAIAEELSYSIWTGDKAEGVYKSFNPYDLIDFGDSNITLTEKLLHPHFVPDHPLMNLLREFALWKLNHATLKEFNAVQLNEFNKLLDRFSEIVGWDKISGDYKEALQSDSFKTSTKDIQQIIQTMLDGMTIDPKRTYAAVLSGNAE